MRSADFKPQDHKEERVESGGTDLESQLLERMGPSSKLGKVCLDTVFHIKMSKEGWLSGRILD